MRTLAIAAATLTLCSPLVGCSSSADTRQDAEPELAHAKTSGGTSTPVGHSRVARPLPEAGERANYPEGFEIGRTRPVDSDAEPFDIGADTEDPMMERETPVATDGDRPASDEAAPGPSECLAELGELRIDVTDVYDGAAIIVTSRSVDADRIFERASTLAQAHGATSAADDGTATAKPGEQPREALDMPPAEVRVIELAHGARIHYLARDTEHDVTELRNAVRRIASSLEQGACPGL